MSDGAIETTNTRFQPRYEVLRKKLYERLLQASEATQCGSCNKTYLSAEYVNQSTH